MKIIYKTVKSMNVRSRLFSQNKKNNEHYYGNSKVGNFYTERQYS